MQGSNKERWSKGEQTGGIIKAYNNKFEGSYTLYTQADRPNDYDAYVVSAREDKVPETESTVFGGNKYSNFDTASDMYSYSPDTPDDVPAIVMAYAGRTEGGDLKWTFNNSTDDSSSAIDVNLKKAIENYQSKVITGIEAVISSQFTIHNSQSLNSQPSALNFYNLSGQRVSGDYRGIVVVGGKKVMR